VVYDTKYAMVDRKDDLVIGIKSTAILFGESDRAVIAVLQVLCLAALALAGGSSGWAWPYYLSLLVAAVTVCVTTCT
jgi:4-hydroxybenzoate polyprenyltransferase